MSNISTRLPEDDTTWLCLEGYFSERAFPERCWIGIRDGVICAIQTEEPESDTRIKLPEGSCAIPLLSDTHVHYYMEPWPIASKDRVKPGSKPFESEVQDALQRIDDAMRCGMGYLRDMGDPHGINLEVKRRVKQSDRPAPELVVPGPAIHRPKKYGRYLGVVKDTIDDIKQFIDELVDDSDADYIKLVATGIVNFEEKIVRQTPQYTVEELADVVEHAHARGKKVAAHCSGADGLDICIDAGVDYIEHAYFITEPQIARLIDKGLVWTPTFAPVYTQGAFDECGWPEKTRETIDEILDEHAASVAKGRQAGAKLMAGTDAGCPGVDMAKGIRCELKSLATAGLDPSDLLRLATVNNAELCGAKTYTGLIEVGGPASFGIYSRSPWKDIGALDDLVAVFHQGERFEPLPTESCEVSAS
jgi:imidazolonepropionase-like amidohydrolase